MDDLDFKNWDLPELGISVRAVLIEAVPVILDNVAEEHDTFFWFATKLDRDRWFAFAVSDVLVDDEPLDSLSESNTEELQKCSIFMGNPWDEIMMGCPHCVAQKHRRMLNNMPEQEFDDMMNSTDENLEKIRAIGSFDGFRLAMRREMGIELSLN